MILGIEFQHILFLCMVFQLLLLHYLYGIDEHGFSQSKSKQTNYMIGLCYAESMYHKLVSENDHKYAISVLSQPVYHMTNVEWLEGYRDYVMNVKERGGIYNGN